MTHTHLILHLAGSDTRDHAGHPRQWRDAFLAGGYTPAVAESFLAVIKARIEQAENVEGVSGALSERTR